MKQNTQEAAVEDDLAASSRKHLVISEFNLVINYAPYLGIFVFPLKDNIFRNEFLLSNDRPNGV